MRRNFLGLTGIRVSTLDKEGKFKQPRTISWLNAGPRIFVAVVLYGVQKIFTAGDIVWWDIPFIAILAFCIYGGFIYPYTNPLQVEELNEVEKEKHQIS